ncbi:unnamed protein product [Ilex paraguariensis]|uniref:Eukaryotic translation initiation factor 4G n=1 Tax=Ilex paraguariensis TaxID=185542 RepID=A0ABC8S796_9AQUA
MSLRRASDAPVTCVTVKPTDVSTQNSTRPLPKAPSSNASTVMSDRKEPTTPAKAPGDPPRSFPFQFGTISPGFMNGMQIPARTSSAPPNLDEQKRDQARHDSVRAGPTFPIPSIPKQQLPRKDGGPVDQSNTGQAHPMPKAKKDVQVSAAPHVSQTQKPSVHPIPGISMPMPFHQPQVPIQFGGPNPQIQSQRMTGTSLPMPMPMPLPMGNPPQVQQPVFVTGLQPHPMQSQGIFHQGQSLTFSSQLGPQLPPQLGNLGINSTPQFSQQQAGKFGGPRKTVKITDPVTHKEFRLDELSGQRSHPSVPPQSQPTPSFSPALPINYYPNTYNSSSLPLTNITSSSQAPKFYNQVTVKPAAAGRGEKVVDSSPSVSSSAVGTSESPKLLKVQGEASPSYPHRDSETLPQSSLQQSKSSTETKSTSIHVASEQSVVLSGSVSVEIPLPSSLSPPPGLVEYSASGQTSGTGGARREMVMSDSIKDPPNKSDNEGHSLPQNQVGQSTSVSSLPSQSFKDTTPECGIPEKVEAKTTLASSGTRGNVLETDGGPPAAIGVATPDASNARNNHAGEGTCELSKNFGAGTKVDTSLNCEQPKLETVGTKEQERDANSFETSSESVSIGPSEVATQIEQRAVQGVATAGFEVGSTETAQRKLKESVGHPTEKSTSTVQDALNAKLSPSGLGLLTISQGDETSSLDAPLTRNNSICSEEVAGTKSGDQQSLPVSIPSLSEAILNCEGEDTEQIGSDVDSFSGSSLNDKLSLESNRAKSSVASAKKKRREMLLKADAAGITSDLYMAYKGPEEKKEIVTSAESMGSSSGISLKQLYGDASQEDDVFCERVDQSKTEPDDWEDAADISTPKLETSGNGKNDHGGLKHHGEDEVGVMAKKYSRDFLLKFAEQCIGLPDGFKFISDIAEGFMVSNFNVPRDTYPTPGRVIDRPTGGFRLDRRGSGMGDDDKWGKLPSPLASGRDMRLDVGYGANVVGFRPGQGGNYGVLRNPRAQTPVQYVGGILSGPMQSLGSQGGVQRNGPESDRWQRATAFQKGLIPSPHATSQVMHKAEKKYEVGKVTDEEQAKQRQLKGILNKLTPQNFEKLFEQVKQVNIDNATTLTGVISQIFDKALTEPTFCEMYANFCSHLAGELPDLSVGSEKITFKRLLLNNCQEEFERGEREQEEANKAEEEGEAKQSVEEREEKRTQARRRMLGNIRLIGELYKKKMLTERIMHECIKKLLGQPENPDEEDVEALCKLMSTIGEMIDHPRAKEHIDVYFDGMAKLSNNMKLSARVRFMLKDSIDLRKNKWQQRRKVEGPKKIEEVHRDAAQERQAQVSRLARGPSISSSVRRGQPMDFGPRGPNMLPSSSAQFGGFRGASPQLRGYGAQDVRFEDRHSFENRTLSVPLPQRPIGDDSITLGPQGGLARGMSIRGQPSVPSTPLADMPSPGDSRRMTGGVNGYNSASERTAYSSREDLIQRYVPEKGASLSAYDTQERNMNYGSRDIKNADHNFDRSLPTSPPTRGLGPAFTQNALSEKVFSKERLQDMSMAAIKEFYSAKDEKEVAQCVKDLNAPSFYPSMISLWVTDSFERKDMERDLLAKLLIDLANSQDVMISQDQLVKGFESVLTTLEDAVNDAPRAAEFLGSIFAKVILGNVIPFTEIGQLIYEGGEEQGRLVEIGLAAELLGSILEIIESEKGDSALNEICTSSNLRLENFRPPGSNKTWRLDKFM